MNKSIDKIRQERQDEIDAQREAEKKELQYKNSYYKNVNSIRKNIQFFFWMTVLPAIIFIIIYFLNS